MAEGRDTASQQRGPLGGTPGEGGLRRGWKVCTSDSAEGSASTCAGLSSCLMTLPHCWDVGSREKDDRSDDQDHTADGLKYHESLGHTPRRARNARMRHTPSQ